MRNKYGVETEQMILRKYEDFINNVRSELDNECSAK